MSFTLFTTIPPRFDADSFISSWESSGFRVVSINNVREANDLCDVEVLKVASEDDRLTIAKIMQTIAQTGESIAGFVNADCLPIRPLDVDALKVLTKGTLIMAERIDVDATGAATTVLSLGFDAFFFDTAPLGKLNDVGYRIGSPWWDYWFPLAMQRAGSTLRRFSCPVLLHTAHDVRWDEAAFLAGGKALCDEFPNLNIMQHGRPNPHPTFGLLQSVPAILAPGFDRISATLFSSILALVRKVHDLPATAQVMPKPAEVLSPEVCHIHGAPPSIFAISRTTCSVCAESKMIEADVVASVTAAAPFAKWIAVDKSSRGLGTPTPYPCTHTDGRQHWFLEAAS